MAQADGIAMSTEIATQTQPQQKPAQQFAALLDAKRDTFAASLPKHIDFDRFRSSVITAVSLDGSLLQADRASLFTACMQCAADGLLPNKRDAAFVTFSVREKDKDGREQWIKKVQYMPMVAGVLKKLRNSGEISSFTAQCVYEHDVFEFEFGLTPKLRHVPKIPGDRGKLICVYAACRLKDGSDSFEVMTLDQVDRRRAVSKSKSGPWVDWYDEMAKKTVIRALCKVLPSSTDIDRVIERLDSDVDLSRPSQPAIMPEIPEPEMGSLPAEGEVIE